MAEVPAPVRATTLAQAINKKRKEVFLKVLAQTGQVLKAANAAGWKDTRQVYHIRAQDEEFAEAWEAAIYASVDDLEDEAISRGRDGVRKPVFYKGEIVGHEIEYSDTLLMEMMRARRPERFRKSSQEINVDVNVNAKVGVAVLPMVASSEADWEAQAGRLVENKKALPAFIDAAVEQPQQSSGKPSEMKQEAATAQPKTGSFNQSFGRS